MYREVAKLGEELKSLGTRTLSMRTKSDIAILFDWDNWWGIEYSAGPSVDLRYLEECLRFYKALRCQNFNVDIVGVDTDLSGYKLAIAPVYYMVKGENDHLIRKFVKEGGAFLTTFFSGIVQENDLVTLFGYPGKLRDILGVWVEEEDALEKGVENEFIYRGKKYPAFLLCDLLHLEGAKDIKKIFIKACRRSQEMILGMDRRIIWRRLPMKRFTARF